MIAHPPRLWRACVLAALVTLARQGPATAGPDRARQLFDEAERYFRRQEFSAALGLYMEAHRVRPLPELLFNIGQCHRHLGSCADALPYFRRFLREARDSRYRPQVKELVAECERATASGQPPDGEAGGEAGAGDTVSEQPRQGTGADPPSAPAPSGGLSRGWFWAGVGVTAGLLAAGVVSGAAASAEYDDALAAATPAAREDSRSTARTLAVVSWVSLGLAVGSAVGSGVMLWYSRSASSAVAGAPRLGMAATPVPGGGLLSLGGSFR